MKRISSFLKILLLILLYGCTGQVKERKNIICLIDYSGTITKETLKTYANIISRDIFLNLGQSDKFLLMPIDEGAKTEDVLLAYYDLKNNKFDQQSDGVTHRQDSVKRRLSLFLSTKSDTIYNQIFRQKEIRNQFTDYTDIINAVEQLQSKLEKNETKSGLANMWDGIAGNTTFHSENILVICSDMIHESKEFNFNKSPTITKAEADEILKHLKNANRIPDLSGMIVFVNGRTGRNNNQIDNLKYFWESYFKEAKATLSGYDFDTHHLIVDHLNKIRTE